MRKKRADTEFAQLKLRLREPLRRALETAAKKRGASINYETTRRLEQSFVADQQLDQAFGGREIYGLMRVVSTAFVEAGMIAAHSVSAQNFVENPFAFDQAVHAANKVLEAFRPAGEIMPPANVTGLSGLWNEVVSDLNANPGRLAAESLLDKLRSEAGLPTIYQIGARDEHDTFIPKEPNSPRARRLMKDLSPDLTQRLHPNKRKSK